MSRTALQFLWNSAPPWIYVGFGEPNRDGWIPAHFYASEGLDVCTRRLRGWKMASVSDAMSEIGSALQFADHFGGNWYALEESLCYLDEWLPAAAYVIVVERAEELLPDDEAGLEALLATFKAAGEFWSRAVDGPARFERPSRPFHLLLNVGAEHPAGIARIQAAAAAVSVSLRTDALGALEYRLHSDAPTWGVEP